MSGDSFFHRFFAALDSGDADAAMALVADDLQFVILWAPDQSRDSRHFTGGPAQLRAFTVAGDMEGWGHHILHVTRTGSTEIALGETRWDDGQHIGTFVCAAELTPDGLMRRYLVGRSPSIEFSPEMMSSQSTIIP